jgi:iron complex outermembrane receptor protein
MNESLPPSGASYRYALTLTPLAAAVAAILSSGAALSQEARLEEIIVTAQKRTQNLQDVPVSVQVLGGEQLQELNLNDFADFVHFIPTISYSSENPGMGVLYMRGVASGGDGLHSASLPSVGVYLDEQPVTTINTILDVHVYDFERIEALSGPQGTLFGASSQSGTLRMITNKPVIGEFQAAADISTNFVEHGDMGYTVEGFANIPISDNAAIRLVGWHKETAGYIDNVPGTITMPGNPGFFHENSAMVEEDFNTSTTSGARALLKIDLNDNWTVTPGLMYQQQDSEGVWQHDPEDAGDLNVIRFRPDWYEDEWYQAALTVDGDIGNLNLVYAGAYFERTFDRYEDYIGYGHYLQNLYDSYYGSCYHHASTSTYDNYVCTDPDQYATRWNDYDRQSHELRLQSAADTRFRWTAGLFYQRQQHDFDHRWNVPGMDPLGSDIFPVRPPSPVGPGDPAIWLTDQTRVDRDRAIFGEAEFDLTEKLTVVGGIRYFEYENSLFGYNGYNNRCLDANGAPQWPCRINAPNIDDVSEGDGETYKLSVAYNLSDEKMLYALYSEGFRAGGVNRAQSAGQFLPKYEPDYVDNYEIGWKTKWLDGRLRFNAAAYYLKWTDFQLSYLDTDVSPLTIIQNVGNSETTGFEFDAAFAATETLSFTLSGTYNDAELQDDFWTNSNNEANGLPPTAAAGTQLPSVPEIRWSATGRQLFDIGRFPGYFQAALTYTSDSWDEINTANRDKQPSFTIVNLAVGVDSEAWSLDLFLDNATDERAVITNWDRNYADPVGNLFYDTVQTTNRPRTLGLRFSRRW